MKKRILSSNIMLALSFVLVLLGFLTTNTKEVEAKTPLPKWDKVEVVGNNTVIDDEFTFIPQYTNRTRLRWTGGVWKRTNWSRTDSSQKFRTFDVRDSRNKKGEMAAIYTNVGYYKGQSIDLRIEVKNWRLNHAGRFNNTGNISFQEDMIAVSTSGFDWVDLDWQFVRSGTNRRVPVKGYFTISDIDRYQAADISNSLFRAIDKIYVGSTSNQLWYKRLDHNWGRISTEQGEDVIGYDDRYAFTYTFNSSSMRIRWATDWSRRPNGRPYYRDQNHALGERFYYSAEKPARFDTPRVFKSVNNRSLKHPQSTDRDLVYDLSFTVPGETPNSYYSNMTITDTVDPTLSVKDVKFYSRGRDVTNRFNIDISGRKVTAKAKRNQLRNHSFYDNEYRMEIRTTINKSSMDRVFSERDSNIYNITNRARLDIDGRPKTSNRVITRVEGPVYYRATVNHIDIESGETITASSREILEGEPYYETSIEGLMRGKYNYKSLAPKVQSGTMTKDMVINFYYRVPKLTIENYGIDIFTDELASSQPADVFVKSKIKDSGDSIGDFAGGRVRLSVVDITNGGEVWSSTYPISTLFGKRASDSIPINISHSTLNRNSDGERTRYRYQLEIVSRGTNNYELITDNASVNTHGYTSSKYVVTNSDKGSDGGARLPVYEGVVMTEANSRGRVDEHFESLMIYKIDQPRLKSGYGYEFNPRIRYEIDSAVRSRVNNRVSGRKTDSKPYMEIDERVVDLSDSYIQSRSKVPIDLDIRTNSGDNRSAVRDINYHLPRAFLSRDDGRIRYNRTTRSVDAGNKMYVPVWIKDLGKYEARLKHSQRIGSNKIGINMFNEVDVYAFMLNHTDSDTPDLDELLLHPMSKEDDLFDWKP